MFTFKQKKKKTHLNIYRHVRNHTCNIIHLSAPHPQSTRLPTLCFRTEMEVCLTWTGENICECLDHSMYWPCGQTVISVFWGHFVDKTFLQNPFKLTAFGSQYLTVDQRCERSPTRSSFFYALLGRGASGDGVLLCGWWCFTLTVKSGKKASRLLKECNTTQMKQCDGSLEIRKDKLNDTQQTTVCFIPKLPPTAAGRINSLGKILLAYDSVCVTSVLHHFTVYCHYCILCMCLYDAQFGFAVLYQ